jgi:hypothetical protein
MPSAISQKVVTDALKMSSDNSYMQVILANNENISGRECCKSLKEFFCADAVSFLPWLEACSPHTAVRIVSLEIALTCDYAFTFVAIFTICSCSTMYLASKEHALILSNVCFN